MFQFFSLSFCSLSRALSNWHLVERIFAPLFILASKTIFVNLLNSGIVLKYVALWTLFSVSVYFVFKAVFVARLEKSYTIFQIYASVIVTKVVITNPETVGSCF